MPDEEAIGAMYGPAYAEQGCDEDPEIVAAMDEPLIAALDERRGVFLDYGCGSGKTLSLAARAGWECYGVEFDQRVAAATAQRTGIPVLVNGSELPQADVIFFGDVLEHFPRPADELRLVLRAAKPGARLIAQGPLENNPNVFNLALRAHSRLRRAAVDLPPYHLTMATTTGQMCLFERSGLACSKLVVSEVDWPAPRRPADARGYALLALRRASRLISRCSMTRLGNRYFYIGQLGAAEL